MSELHSEAIKIVFWDLDGTLWPGTLDEDEGELTAPLENVSSLMLELDKRGILNSVVSQASAEAAGRRLASAGLSGLFVAPSFGASSKAQAIRKSLLQLNLLPQNAAFVDDLPFYRAEVSALLPQVLTLSPSDLAAFSQSPRVRVVSSVGASRRLLYQQEEQRQVEEMRFAGTRQDFLMACSMVMTCGEAVPGSPEEARLLELFARAHRMSLLPPSPAVDSPPGRWFEGLPSHTHTYGLLSDRFGDYGVVAAARLQGSTSTGRTVCSQLAISCRVQGRGVLETFLTWVGRRVASAGRPPALGLCASTASEVNLPLRTALRLCGFSPTSVAESWELLELAKPDRLCEPEWVSLRSKG